MTTGETDGGLRRAQSSRESAGVLRTLLIGLGPRAVKPGGHAEALLAAEGITLSAGCDLDEERRSAFGARHGIPVYGDAAEALEKETPDVVAICTKERPRYALAKLALEAGVRAVVLEKPMTDNIGQARDLVKQVRQRNVLLTVMHQMRFADEFVAAREAIARGEIGRPYFVRAVSYGHLMEQGPHLVDMILYLLDGARPEWVMGQVADREEGLKTSIPAPAFTVGYVAFEGGVRASVECGIRFPPAVGFPEGEVNSPWLEKRVQVLGTEGICDTIVAHSCRIINTQEGWRTLAAGRAGWDKATVEHYSEVARVLAEGGEHRNGAEPSLTGFEIIHGIYQSAVVGDRVPVPVPGEPTAPVDTLMTTRS